MVTTKHILSKVSEIGPFPQKKYEYEKNVILVEYVVDLGNIEKKITNTIDNNNLLISI